MRISDHVVVEPILLNSLSTEIPFKDDILEISSIFPDIIFLSVAGSRSVQPAAIVKLSLLMKMNILFHHSLRKSKY